MDDKHWESAEEGAELLIEGKHEEARDYLLALVEREKENPYAHYFLGQAFFELHDYARALACYVRSLEISPRYLGALIGSGHALRLMGRFDSAIRAGRQALLMQPNDPDALHLLGVAHFVRGDDAQAADFLRRFLATRPELEVATEVEGMLQLLAQKLEPAPEDDA